MGAHDHVHKYVCAAASKLAFFHGVLQLVFLSIAKSILSLLLLINCA